MTQNYVRPLRDSKGKTLPEAAREVFGPRRCPCCDIYMTRTPAKRFQSNPVTYETIGHDFSVARGGDARVWVFMCLRCNNEQGMLDLVTWARKLIHYEDPRAERVTKLAVFIRQWVAENKRKRA